MGLVAIFATLAACPAKDDREQDKFAVATTTLTIQGIAGFAGAIEFIFEADPSWEALSEAQQRPLAIAAVRDNIQTLLDLTVCKTELTTTSDDMTFLEMSIEECFSGPDEGGFDGVLRVDLDIGEVVCSEATPCAALRWTLTSPDSERPFRVIGVQRNGHVEWTLPSLLSVPFDVAEAKHFEADQLETVNTELDKRLGFKTRMNWISSDSCLTVTMNNTSFELIGSPLPAEESDALPIFTRAEDVVTCLAECPRSGDVVLSFGDGTLLGWAYNQTPSIEVRGTDGAPFQAELDCE
jgi:hypothetical protein